MRKNVLIFGHDYTTQFVDIYNQYSRVFDKNLYHITVVFLTGEPSDEIVQRTLADEIIFLNFPKKNVRGLKIKPIVKLFHLAKAKKFQFVICHRYKPSYIMMCVAKLIPIPKMIMVMHELRTMAAIGRQLVVTCLRQKNMLYGGVSNAVRNDMRQSLRFVPKQKIITLYNMIDVELVEQQMLSRDDARAALGIRNDAFVFGNLARLVPNKDHMTLLKAFASQSILAQQTQLMILGVGHLEQYLQQHAGPNVIFKKFIPCGYKYLKAFDCFVLSSVQEAFGRVLLEAMVAKIPIIATRVHGIPEVMGDVGIVVPARDPIALGKALAHIYACPAKERAQIGNKGYQHACAHFSIQKFKQDFWGLDFCTNSV